MPGWVVSCTATSCSCSRGRLPHLFAPANHKCGNICPQTGMCSLSIATPPHAGAPLCSRALEFIPEPPGGFKPRHRMCCIDTRDLVAGMATCGTRRGSAGGPVVHDEPAFLVTTTQGFSQIFTAEIRRPLLPRGDHPRCCASVVTTETSPSPRLGRDHWASDPYVLN